MEISKCYIILQIRVEMYFVINDEDNKDKNKPTYLNNRPKQ